MSATPSGESGDSLSAFRCTPTGAASSASRSPRGTSRSSRRAGRDGAPTAPGTSGAAASEKSSGAPRAHSAQTVLPRRAWRVPQCSASWATRNRPRPPSSKTRARRARRRRGVVLPASATSHMRVRSFLQLSPGGQLPGDARSAPGDLGPVGIHVASGDLTVPEGVGAGQEECHVVARSVCGQQRFEERVAAHLQGGGGLREGLAQSGEARLDVVVEGLDQAVGAEGDEAALGQVDLRRLERQAARPEWRADGRGCRRFPPWSPPRAARAPRWRGCSSRRRDATRRAGRRPRCHSRLRCPFRQRPRRSLLRTDG